MIGEKKYALKLERCNEKALEQLSSVDFTRTKNRKQ